MKISKTGLMILGIGVMIIAAIVLYLAYSQFSGQRDALFATIDASRKRFAQASADKRTLEPQLSQLQQKTAALQTAYDQARGGFPVGPTQSIEYDEELSKIADDSGVKVTTLVAGTSTPLVEGNLTYVTTDFTATVTGERENTLQFLHRVAINNHFFTATINSVDLAAGTETAPSPIPGAPELPPPVDYSTFIMTITVYRFEGN